MSRSLEDILKLRFARFDRFDVMRWLLRGHKTINKAEHMSLLSLITYSAVEMDVPVEDLQNRFMQHYGLATIENLHSDDYDDAIRLIMQWQEAGMAEAEQSRAIAG